MKLKAERDAFKTVKREALAAHKEKLAVSSRLLSFPVLKAWQEDQAGVKLSLDACLTSRGLSTKTGNLKALGGNLCKS